MNQQSTMASFITVLIIVIALLGYGVFTAGGSNQAVATAVQERTPLRERTEVNVDILNNKVFKDIESLKVFGERPVNPKPEVLERSNPFEGL